MKKSFLAVFISCFLLNACQRSSVNFDWLVGNWIRVNGNNSEKTFEQWQQVSSEEYRGLGFTLVEKDTIFKEELSLVKINENWVYRVVGVHEDEVDFLITKISSTGFSAENKQNEFPKVITYKLKAEVLKATIADDKNAIDFIFEKEGGFTKTE
ncbi:hypothetical protein [Mesonia sp.]|uniref:hypothetical protein n=1 Tax=Mesonia sp. TaxID=1960830 RepID=UPI001767E2AE|nr:hypothetical protein [Mesonia sp.]HIB37434.1 hypothetical protein [Mesonia sp.]HIO26457.1 hypothetical protein [Flavobacteriaceae bacterium]